MFKKEHAPYLFTVAIAMLGWLITRAVDETTKSPLVAYSTNDSVENGQRVFAARFHNISSSTVFRNLYVVLTNLDGTSSKFTSVDLEYEAPIHPDKLRKAAPAFGNAWAGCMISELQPRTAVQLRTTIEGPGVPVVRFDSKEATVRLVKQGFLTIVVENESEILLWMAALTIVLLVIYVIFLSRIGT